MNWINPREKLPDVDQLIWCLFIENREEERCGLPAAKMVIAKAVKDRYGVMYAEEICHKGYAQYTKHFYDWWHWDQSEKQPGTTEEIYRGFGSQDEKETIIAWLPYSGLPLWDCIDMEESRSIIMKTEEYKKGVEYDKAQRIIEKARGERTPYFILLEEVIPTDGLYVVANKEGVWLSRYEKKTCDPWIAPNGKPVIAWYPVPNSY